jgi:transposase
MIMNQGDLSRCWKERGRSQSPRGPVLKYVYTHMRKGPVSGVSIRYSQAFKMAIVREVEQEGKLRSEVMAKYGIKGKTTVSRWLGELGSGKIGRIIRVERPEEVNETKRLRDRVKRLETALADASMDLAMEKGYLRIACERAGIVDVEEFKKKAGTNARVKS